MEFSSNLEYMDFLLTKTMQMRGTDLHLCAGSKPLVRVDSSLVDIEESERLMPEQISEFVHDYLTEFQLKELQREKSLDFSYSRRSLGRFRCNVYYQRGTYAIAIRALPLQIPKFEDLGLPQIVKSFALKTKGLILITGSTGSGKSTTLASLIDYINENRKFHIITVEDPLEYLHGHKSSIVTQREVGGDALNFASALKSALREDPDVIMVGEIRDMETMQTALTAAETGHLVLTTLHTDSAVKAIDRILDSFNQDQHAQVQNQLAAVLEGVVSQQLLPRADKEGLVVAAEVLCVTPAVRNMIREGKHFQVSNLIQTGAKYEMVSMERTLAKLVRDGIISKDVAYAKAADPQLFENYYNHPGL